MARYCASIPKYKEAARTLKVTFRRSLIGVGPAVAVELRSDLTTAGTSWFGSAPQIASITHGSTGTWGNEESWHRKVIWQKQA
jgi:hypothetical protein